MNIILFFILITTKDSCSKKINIPNPNFTYFSIGAGPASGSYFPVASAIAGLITNPPGSPPCERGGSCGVKDLVSIAYATDGALHNVDLMKERKIDSALIQADLLEKEDPIRLISALYPEVLHIVVLQDAPIYKVADLKGKVVSVGKTQSGTFQSVRQLMAILGLKASDYSASHDDPGKACDLLLDAKVDALLFFAGHPVSCLTNLAKKKPLRFLNITPDEQTKISLKSKIYKPYDIEAGLYWNIGKIRTMSVIAEWVTADWASEEVVYQITKAFWLPQNQSKFRTAFPKLNALNLKDSAEFAPQRLHKGALRFYKEMGLLQQEASK